MPSPGRRSIFAGLFDGKWLDDDVQGQFHAMPIDTAVIVLDVFVAEPLRGHHLGPWMVAEVVYRMLPSTSGIVLLSPDPATDDDDVTVTKLFALEKLTHHWARAGLDSITKVPGLLAAEASLGLCDGHALSGPGEVGLELRNHRQRGEQQSAYGSVGS